MKIILAGGCFWGVEAFFQNVPGIVNTEVGYVNGKTANPSYEDLLYRNSDHAEAIALEYLPSLISYEKILEYFFYIIDPTSLNKQGNDVGRQYRTGIYYLDEEEKARALAWLAEEQKKYDQDLMVEVEALKEFYPAEDYHQDYLLKNPEGYCHVNLNLALRKVWEDRLKNLSPLALDVTQRAGTEPPFSSEYTDFFQDGLYFDCISGVPLFSSVDKFPCSCGWPSFAKAIVDDVVEYHEDNNHNMQRIEVRSASSGAHLGHVFDDGPKELGGKRFCINGVALTFVSAKELDEVYANK